MNNYLLFQLSGLLFAVKLVGVLEILPWRAARKVPLAYSYVEGLLDYRGTIYPVYNLAMRLDLKKHGSIGFTAEPQPAPEGSSRSIVLLEENKTPFGIVADGIVKTTSLEEQHAGTQSMKGVEPKYLKGFVYDGGHEIMILDFERLFHGG